MASSANDISTGSPNTLHGVQLALVDSSTGEASRAKTAKALGYWKATQEAASIHAGQPVSFTLDATQVGKNTIQACAATWASNVAAWLFPQALQSPGNVY